MHRAVAFGSDARGTFPLFGFFPSDPSNTVVLARPPQSSGLYSIPTGFFESYDLTSERPLFSELSIKAIPLNISTIAIEKDLSWSDVDKIVEIWNAHHGIIYALSIKEPLAHHLYYVSHLLLQIRETLTCLQLPDSRVTNEDLKVIREAQLRLEVLDLSGNHPFKSKDLINLLDELPDLTALDLSGMGYLSGELYRTIRSLKCLQRLSLARHASLDDKTATEILTHCPKLQQINLSYCNQVTKEFIKKIHILNNIKSILLNGIDISMGRLIQLLSEKCPNLKSICIDHTKFSRPTADRNNKQVYPQIHHISNGLREGLAEDFHIFRTWFPSLRSLSLVATDIDDAGLSITATFQDLAILDLASCKKITFLGVSQFLIQITQGPNHFSCLGLKGCDQIDVQALRSVYPNIMIYA